MLKKIIALLLLTITLASQYERYLSFLECKLAYYMTTAGERCDCEKLLVSANEDITAGALPMVHQHLHPDEAYYPSLPLTFLSPSFSDEIVQPPFFTGLLPSGFPRSPDQPPDLLCIHRSRNS